MTHRKSPIKHHVKSHERDGVRVKSHTRGSGSLRVVRVIRKGAKSREQTVRDLSDMSTPRGYYTGLALITSGKQKAFYEWVLKHGKSFTGRPLSKAEESKIKTYLRRKQLYKPKQCFYNAQSLVLFTAGEYTYYEGMATTEKLDIPFAHAWVVKDGKIIDPTWRDGREYFGVHIPNDVIFEEWHSSGLATSVLGRYAYQILEGKSL